MLRTLNVSHPRCILLVLCQFHGRNFKELLRSELICIWLLHRAAACYLGVIKATAFVDLCFSCNIVQFIVAEYLVILSYLRCMIVHNIFFWYLSYHLVKFLVWFWHLLLTVFPLIVSLAVMEKITFVWASWIWLTWLVVNVRIKLRLRWVSITRSFSVFPLLLLPLEILDRICKYYTFGVKHVISHPYSWGLPFLITSSLSQEICYYQSCLSVCVSTETKNAFFLPLMEFGDFLVWWYIGRESTKQWGLYHDGHKPWPWRPQQLKREKLTLNVQLSSFNMVG